MIEMCAVDVNDVGALEGFGEFLEGSLVQRAVHDVE